MRIRILNRQSLSLFFLLLAGGLFFLGASDLAGHEAVQTAAVHVFENPDMSLRISEVSPCNTGLVIDGAYTGEDYIELFNPTENVIFLDGYYLYDDPELLYDYPLPSHVSIEPGGYLVIYAVGEEYEEEEEENQGEAPMERATAPFRFSDGDTLFLGCRNSSGNHMVDMVRIPTLESGTVYARALPADDAFSVMHPSPGLPNDSAAFPLEAPVFSAQSGFYKDSLTLSMSGPEDAAIYYTLDGSIPGKDSLLYTEPILLTDPSANRDRYASLQNVTAGTDPYEPPKQPVDKAVVVRAAAIDERGNYSNPSTATYFFGFEDREGYENAMILSLVTDPSLLFGEESGIYVTGEHYTEALEAGVISEKTDWITLMEYTSYFMRGPGTERPVCLEVFDKNHALAFSQECGIRIRGNESRSFPQKSFTLFARNRYGTGEFAPVFFDSGISYKSLILNGSARLSKVFVCSLVEDRFAMVQRYMPCQVFLNGEYWGMYYLMEKYSADMLEKRYGVEEEQTLLIKNAVEVQDGAEEDYARFEELVREAQGNLSDPEIYEALAGQMDIQNYIDWVCTNIYVANTDALPLGRNVFSWQSLPSGEPSGYSDGRWRWILYDLDDSMGLQQEGAWPPVWKHDTLINHFEVSPTKDLLENARFRQQFVLTFLDMANENFSPRRVNALLDQALEDWGPMSRKQEERWNSNALQPSLEEQAEVIRGFFENRFDFAVPLLGEYLGLSGELCTLTLSQSSPEKGTIRLNTISPDLTEGVWEGRYFKDYPMTLSAEPAFGRRFAGWEITGGTILSGSASSREIVVGLDSEDVQIRAVFR